MTNSKLRINAAHWLILLTLVGYPLAAVLVEILGVESRMVTVPFRAAILGLCLALLALWVHKPTKRKFDATLFIFLALYLCRLVYDKIFLENPYASDAITYFLITCVPVVLAVYFTIERTFSEQRFARNLLFLSGLAVLGYYGLLLSGRIQYGLGERAMLSALNPISLGHIAATSIICAVYITIKSERRIWKLVAVIIFSVAVPALLSAGSRGPMVSLAIAILWLGFTNKRRGFVIFPSIAIGAFFIPQDNILFDRLFGLSQTFDLSSLMRLEFQRNAFIDLLENPILGKHFFDPTASEGSYPHNLYLEVGMALGLVGLSLIILVTTKVVFYSNTYIKNEYPLIVALMIQYFIGAQLSGAIWSNDKLFMLLSAILALGKILANEKRLIISQAYAHRSLARFP